MGIQYGNLTLQGVDREQLIDYLSQITRETYVTPIINNFITVYDRAADGPDREDVAKLAKLDSKAKEIIDRYRDGSYFALAILARHLSEVFSCPALAVCVYDGSYFWYHLCQNGKRIDEYTTCGNDDWRPGTGLNEILKSPQIKGGNSRIICSAFKKEMVIEEVEIIIRKPVGISDASSLSHLTDYEFLLQVDAYSSPLERHEALARVLGMCPGFVLGLNYRAMDTGEFAERWEDFRDPENNNVPTAEEIESIIIKTPKKIT
ncbi:MAG TPA: hypothetical protein V6D37_04735 [Candidatus Sericytochromatia bacterium]|jgi:hypothetical protein